MNADPRPSRDHRNTDVARSVIEAIADAEEVDPRQLEPLYDVVDPDALNGLFVEGAAGGRVVFRYQGYDVTVGGDGRVTLEKGDR